MLKPFILSLKLLWREWQSGQWVILFLALIVAITSITTVHFYTERLFAGLAQQNSLFLGGDLAITSASPPQETWKNKATQLNLKMAEIWSYPTMINAQQKFHLIEVQAVSSLYPLYNSKKSQPAKNTVWIEPRLFALLKISKNDTITIGSKKFKVAQTIPTDMPKINTGWLLGPRVILNLTDVPATQTVLPGSRVNYRLLVAGDKQQVAAFKEWLNPRLTPDQRIIDAQQQSTTNLNIFQQIKNYINLVLLISLILGGIVIALSTKQYIRTHKDQVALWRCLGASQKQLMQIYFYQLLLLALFAGGLAVLTGFIVQSIFANIFQYFIPFPLPQASIFPVVSGLSMSVLYLFIFSYPIIFILPKAPPLILWHDEEIPNSFFNILLLIVAIIFFILLINFLMGFTNLSINLSIYLFVVIAILYLINVGLLKIMSVAADRTQGIVRRGLQELLQHKKSFTIQYIAFNLVLIALLILTLVRNHLIDNWQQALPEKTPNYFIFNIAETDLPALKQFFLKQQINIEQFYPMVRGRLIALNGKAINEVVPEAARKNNALHRELNLSWMLKFPSDNKIVAGENWPPKDYPSVSVENNLAQNLNLQLGDQLTFQIGSQKQNAKIANFRSVEWASFHPNFFMIFTPGVFIGFPTTYITSFYLLPKQQLLLNELIQSFPNMTIIDVADLLAQVKNLIEKLTLGLQYLFLFALLEVILVVAICLQASMDERRKTYTLLHVLGASQRYVRKSIIAEFSVFALMILLSTSLISWLIILGIEYYFF